MWSWFVRLALSRWGRRYGYDVSYMKALLAASPRGFRRFTRIMAVAGHGDGVPSGALYAAKLVAAVSEDCGPCTELVVRMAQEAGVDDGQIAAVLERRFGDMAPEIVLAARFAEAVVAHDVAADEHRDVIRSRWGDEGVATLALAIAIGRVFPMLKAGMGYARECRPVEIGGGVVRVIRRGA
jgi:alkylhydroperoxidase family enzyme